MTVKLTALGRFVNQHSVLTPVAWWQKLYKEVDRLNDQDEELGLSMLDERIRGMQELRRDWYGIVNNRDAPCGAHPRPNGA